MFYTFLPKLLNMSITASVVILLVLLARVLLKKAPKVISYALWSIALIRLLCPISIASTLSFFSLLDTPVVERGIGISSIDYISDDIAYTAHPTSTQPTPNTDNTGDHTIPQEDEALRADMKKAPVAACIWIAGLLVMGIYAAVSYIRLRRKLITASPLRNNIYLTDEISSPFVMGLFRPRIYLPSVLDEREQAYIIRHEQHHIRRYDHVIRMLAFVAVCIHWFNPLVWIAFILSGRDMEMSCDEAVIKKMGPAVLADYTASLLGFATGRHILMGMPLAFGEGDTKERIRNLARWKKPAAWTVLALVIACTVLAACLLTNPQTAKLPFELESITISWAKSLDCRPNEPVTFDLNDAELEELKSRLSDLKIGKKDDDLGGFTPLYSISIQANGYYFSVQGFDTDGKHTALYYQGAYYQINDREFSEYLQNTCAGKERKTASDPAEEPLVQSWEPLVTVTSGGKTIVPYHQFAASYNEMGHADGAEIEYVLSQLVSEDVIPELYYGEDFSVAYDENTECDQIQLFSENFERLENISDVAEIAQFGSGSYYIAIVAFREAAYIPQVGEYGYEGYACTFLLHMSENTISDTLENSIDKKYYLTLGTENVASIQFSVGNGNSVIESISSPLFHKGYCVHLEALDGLPDLRGLEITALDEQGNILWQAAIPANAENAGFTRLTQDGWTITDLKPQESCR